MPRYLILRLDGPMQAWGTHTFEDFRPSNLFPTRSGLLGLLAACLGIDRSDQKGNESLATSIALTVRVDREALRPNAEASKEEFTSEKKNFIKLSDYHTVYEARRANRPPKEGETIQSWREYLFDASFTVAVGETENASIKLDKIAESLKYPCFTPVLGRRSCPIARPLIDGDIFEASSAEEALQKSRPAGGIIYAEGDWPSEQPINIRDVPIHDGRNRKFGTRKIYVHKESSCS